MVSLQFLQFQFHFFKSYSFLNELTGNTIHKYVICLDQDEQNYFKKAVEDRKKRYELNEKKKKKREDRGQAKVCFLYSNIIYHKVSLLQLYVSFSTNFQQSEKSKINNNNNNTNYGVSF